MSQEAYERIVQAYESWEAGRAFADHVCLHDVSKIMHGEYRVQQEATQDCPEEKCKTLKRQNIFEMKIESGPCDSEVSKETLNGMMEGEVVTANKDGDATERGGATGKFKWGGAGSTVVGRSMAISNAGTHHDPLHDCEKCHSPGHAEGWIRGAIIEGHNQGCRVIGSIAYTFDPQGDGSEGGSITGVFEGMIIRQCND